MVCEASASGRVDEMSLKMSLMSHNLDWDHNLATIDSLLDTSGDVYPVLSKSQRAGLCRMREMLMKPQHQNKESHIPEELFTMARSENGEVCDYIISSFGGVVHKKRSLKKFVRATINAKSFINRLTETQLRRSSVVHGLPEEFMILEPEERQRVSEILSWENLSKWNFDIFELDKLTNGNPLLFVGWALLASPDAQTSMSRVCGKNLLQDAGEGYGFGEALNFSSARLWDFLRNVEADYNRETQYHNNTHAADVTQTLHCLLQMDNTVSNFSPIKVMATILAAICHDVQHPGVNNSYLVNSRSAIAILYNDASVLENMHAAKTFEKILGPNRNPALDIFQGMNQAQVDSIRDVMVYAILHTDMTKHFAAVNRIKVMMTSIENSKTTKFDGNEENFFLSYLLHIADISNAAKPGPLFIDWADRCLEEFFAQGDKEKAQMLPISPLCDRDTTSRPQSQIGFIEFVIHPAYEALDSFIPQLKKEVMPLISKNLSYWKEQLKESKKD